MIALQKQMLLFIAIEIVRDRQNGFSNAPYMFFQEMQALWKPGLTVKVKLNKR